MASNVTSNPSSVKSPSPAPAPGVLPIQSIPAPTDVRTIESITQAMEVTSDFLGHVQSAVRLDVPVVSATGSGFTTVTASLSPALGGTVTPSGSVHIADGTRFVIQIQTGGAVGTATFKTSVDGGNTYGTLQTTAASMTDSTSGITLAFAGTFNANGTATFRSAFTPASAWVDAGGSLRTIVDHVGFRRGLVNEYYEDWLALGSGTLTGVVSSTTGRVCYSLPSNVTVTLGSTTAMAAAPAINVVSSNATLTNMRLFSAASLFTSGIAGTSLVVEFEILLSSNTATDWKIGFSNTVTSGTPSNSEHAFALCKQATDTTWQLLTSNGVAFAKTNTGVTPSTTLGAPDRITMEFHNTGTAYGFAMRMSVNGGPPVTSAGGAPVQPMSFCVSGTPTNATSSASLFVSPVRAISARYSSTPPY